MRYFYKIIKALVSIIFAMCSITLSTHNFNTQDYLISGLNLILGIFFIYYTFKILSTLFKEDYEKIKIVYHSDIDKIKRIPIGNWIDMRSAEDILLKKGESKLINLGVSMQLPDGYEAHLVPRSSTYKNFKIIQTNHMGVIDNSYSGTNDIWKFPALATEDTVIHKNDRICQFRIVKSQPKVHFIETDSLNEEDRGGFGSTGK